MSINQYYQKAARKPITLDVTLLKKLRRQAKDIFIVELDTMYNQYIVWDKGNFAYGSDNLMKAKAVCDQLRRDYILRAIDGKRKY